MDYQIGLFEAISESNDYIPSIIPLDNENLNLPDSGYYMDKIGTTWWSENIINKAFDDAFPLIKEVKPLQEKEKPKNGPFNIKTYKKRGRKKSVINDNNEKKTKRKIHCKNDDDNILIKIQVHFLTFVIKITNDIIKQYLKENKSNFLPIDYKYKKNITLDYITELKSKSIKDILQNKPSPKCRNYKEDYNIHNYKNLLEKIKQDKTLNWINDFFNLKYLELFDLYYTNDKKKYFVFKNNIINLSNKTESFCDLIEKNQNAKERFKKIISEKYFDRESQQSKNIFSISKNQ